MTRFAPKPALAVFPLVALAATFLACTDREATSGVAGSSAGDDLASDLRFVEQAITQRINVIRQEHGLAPLQRNAPLTRVARTYSCEMAAGGFFAHESPSGEDAADRVLAAGLEYRAVGENLAYTTNAPDPVDAAIDGWMKSDGHRENILSVEYTWTGVGVCRNGETLYYTQLFFDPR